ncbi:hypothetical protein DCS_02932 [Drechmeria coniospora]|uniref:BHLH domain-containing protein n=1 Tax=Drechmeria coniospora TaxID=98403 RepID=A0A151GXG1_DRECN|nr:hypothetical protein DCS_02932 [Drechmeria coniospora]KYK61788.1 hypothetical protein DCS_02932 [Drechmeria coniospora]
MNLELRAQGAMTNVKQKSMPPHPAPRRRPYIKGLPLPIAWPCHIHNHPVIQTNTSQSHLSSPIPSHPITTQHNTSYISVLPSTRPSDKPSATADTSTNRPSPTHPSFLHSPSVKPTSAPAEQQKEMGLDWKTEPAMNWWDSDLTPDSGQMVYDSPEDTFPRTPNPALASAQALLPPFIFEGQDMSMSWQSTEAQGECPPSAVVSLDAAQVNLSASQHYSLVTRTEPSADMPMAFFQQPAHPFYGSVQQQGGEDAYWPAGPDAHGKHDRRHGAGLRHMVHSPAADASTDSESNRSQHSHRSPSPRSMIGNSHDSITKRKGRSRSCHNQIEKNYRMRLNDHFVRLIAVLQTMVPKDDEFATSRAPSKGAVLNLATQKLLEMASENRELVKEVARLESLVPAIKKESS